MTVYDQSPGRAVLVLGDANADITLQVPFLPGLAHESVAHDLRWGSGGSAAHVAVGLMRLATPAILLACVGRDPAAAIALDDVVRHDGSPTSCRLVVPQLDWRLVPQVERVPYYSHIVVLWPG